MSTVTILTNDQYLSVGDTLAATSGSYQLTLSSEGALILTSGSASSPPVWQSPKDPNADGGSYFAIMQSDGNFCVYRGEPGRIEGGVWATMCTIPGGGRCFAVIDADGVFAVYRGTDQANIQGLLWSLDSAGANLIQKWAPMIHLHPADKSHPDSVDNFLAVASLYNGDGSPPVTPA